MDPSYENDFLQFKKWISIVVIATIPAVAIVWDDQVENAQVNKEQTVELKKIQAELTSVKLEISRIENGFDSDRDSTERPGYCMCIAKDNSVIAPSKKYLKCTAKNFVCDDESREICDKQHQEFDC